MPGPRNIFANPTLVTLVIAFSLPGQQEIEMGERVDPDSGAANGEDFQQGQEGRETCDSCRNPGAWE